MNVYTLGQNPPSWLLISLNSLAVEGLVVLDRTATVGDKKHMETYVGPFSSQKFSPKNFHLPFKHMYEALNVIK